MGTLRTVIAAVETILVDLGYTRSLENFTLDNVPTSTIHKSYTLGITDLRVGYLSDNRADYLDSIIELLISWKVFGSHNSTKSYQEGYLDCLDAYEALETAIVKNQLSASTENNLFGDTRIEPFNNNQKYLLMTIPLHLDVQREM